MSEISEERGCGTATMYVITEKGLEMGPFMYGKETDSRVLCTNTGHIYYSQRKDGHRGTDTRDFEDKRRLRIVDLGNSLLPSENTVLGSSQSGRLAFRDMRENFGLTGKFRTNRAIRRSCKARANSEEDRREQSGQMHLGILKQVLDRTCLRDAERKTSENNNNDEYPKVNKKENEQPTIRSRQTELKELQLKRKSKDLLDELARWKERYCLARKDVGSEPELEKREKKIFFSSRIKTAGDRNILPRLNLSSSLTNRASLADCSKNELRNNNTTTRESSTTRIISQKDRKLIFLNPNSLYSQEKAETTAKLNINESKFKTSEKPKVRFPSVIDQRTGAMHSVPGVVSYRPCDYNRWSRKNNIVRRSVVHSRSPSITYVSVFPSIPEK